MEDGKKEPPQAETTPEPTTVDDDVEDLPPVEEPPTTEEKVIEEEKKEENVAPKETIKPEVQKEKRKRKKKVKKVQSPPPPQEEATGWGFGWFSNASKNILSTVANTLTVVEDSEESSEEEEESEGKKDDKEQQPLPVIGTEFFSGLYSQAKGFLDTVEKKSSEIIENVKEQTTQLIEQSGVMETMSGLLDQLFSESDDDFQHVDIKPIDLTRENRIEELVGQMKGFEKMGILVRLREECEKVIELMKNGEDEFHNKTKIIEGKKGKQQEEGEEKEGEEVKKDDDEDGKKKEKEIIVAYISEIEKQINGYLNIALFREKMKKEEYVHLMKTEIGRNVKKLSRNGVNTTEHSVKNFNMYASKEAKTHAELTRQGMGLIVKLRKIENWFSSIILCLGVANILHYSNVMCNEKRTLYIPSSFLHLQQQQQNKSDEKQKPKQQQPGDEGDDQNEEKSDDGGKRASTKEICHVILIFLKLLMHETQTLRTKFTDSIQKIYSVIQVKTGDEEKKVHGLTMETCQSLIHTESFSLKEVEKMVPLFQTILLFAVLKFGDNQ